MGKQPPARSAHLTLLSAALRHLRDAEHLADATSPHLSLDQAYHLAGFAPECARKAAIAAPWVNKPLGHELGDNAEVVLELALTLDPFATRYALQGWGTTYPALDKWEPGCRYEQTSTFTSAHVEPLLREARRVVEEIMAALWADGRLPLERLR
ncbi:MAG TPA: hypothetical protein VL242_23090 [Sorangium sp.]|nr:hypothetical protein [Sorangium sp.]